MTSLSFDPDTTNPHIAKAVELREIFARDAVERDKAGGRPTEQIRLLKESGLLTILIPKQYGGAGEPYSTALRITREFAKVDGSLAHIYGYHFGPVHGAFIRGTPEQAADIYRRSAAGNWFWGNSGNSFSKTLFGKRDDEGWIIDGFKPFSSGSHVADYISVSWQDEGTKERSFAAIPANREGIVIHNDWDGVGQRQTGSGRVSYNNVRVFAHEVIGGDGITEVPFRTIGVLHQQSVLLNVFIGSAQGALLAARDYTDAKSRPWMYSGVERHIDDPWIKRQYGELYIKTRAATALANKALKALDHVWERGFDLTEKERGEAAVILASANVLAGNVALEVTSEIFEVMGARSAVRKYGFDRFWRNVRTHTLHNPAEYKTRNVGTWFLTGDYPEPGIFQ
jgi:alkylation response protein AidB-like acyl-CoA dehydrogenase